MLGAGFIKFHKLFQKLLVMGGGGRKALQLHLLFCKIVCHDYLLPPPQLALLKFRCSFVLHCKLFQTMPYIIILKVRKFHQPIANRFSTARKKPVGHNPPA